MSLSGSATRELADAEKQAGYIAIELATPTISASNISADRRPASSAGLDAHACRCDPRSRGASSIFAAGTARVASLTATAVSKLPPKQECGDSQDGENSERVDHRLRPYSPLVSPQGADASAASQLT
jgi:hypothetical protein